MKANSPTSRVRVNGQNFYPRYYRHDDFEYAIGCTPKAGSSSLSHTCKRHNFKFAGIPPRDRPIVLVLRHPLDRLTSCYEFFVTKNNVWPGGIGGHPGWGLPFDSFVEHTEKHDNMHWAEQTFQHPDWRSYEPLPLKHLSDWWPERFGPMDHRKKMKRRPWREYFTDAQFERQSARYAEDIEAYELACNQGIFTR